MNFNLVVVKPVNLKLNKNYVEPIDQSYLIDLLVIEVVQSGAIL